MTKTERAITELQLGDVPQVYHNLRYNDGEICFADNITSIPGLVAQFKVNFIAFVFVLRGNLTLELDGKRYQLGVNCAALVDRNHVVTATDRSDDFECMICVVSTDVGFSFINKSLLDSMLHLASNPVIQFNQEEIDLMMHYRDLLVFKMDHPQLNYGRETVRDIIRCFAYDLLSNFNQHLSDDGDVLRQGDKLFRRFMLLLAESSARNRSVSDYADRLCVSPKYLTSVCRKHGGSTASELIALAVVGRIKQLLLYSDMSIKEVATEMGFDNLSFFGKYVKKHLGLSPNNYRKAGGYGK